MCLNVFISLVSWSCFVFMVLMGLLIIQMINCSLTEHCFQWPVVQQDLKVVFECSFADDFGNLDPNCVMIVV